MTGEKRILSLVQMAWRIGGCTLHLLRERENRDFRAPNGLLVAIGGAKKWW